jgi:hypothetical protein
LVGPKFTHEERKLDEMRRNLGSSAATTSRKDLAEQEAFVEELRHFLEEVKNVAPLWMPNLEDGVPINFGLLWRLVPQNKPWQAEVKAVWDSLCAEESDWAHLAMHLWPERVVPKCATDRSLAIAHGLEDVFWVYGDDGKWKPRPIPGRPMDQLIRERSSSAVKSALKSFLQAPNGASATRSRRRNSEGVVL